MHIYHDSSPSGYAQLRRAFDLSGAERFGFIKNTISAKRATLPKAQDWRDFYQTYGAKKYSPKEYSDHPWKNTSSEALVTSWASFAVSIPPIMLFAAAFNSEALLLAFPVVIIIAFLYPFFVKSHRKEYSYYLMTTEDAFQLEDVHPLDLHQAIVSAEVDEHNELWDMFDDYLDVYVNMIQEPTENTRSHNVLMEVLHTKKKIIMDTIEAVSKAQEQSMLESSKIVDMLDEDNAEYLKGFYADVLNEKELIER